MKRLFRFSMLVILSLTLATGAVSCHKNASVKNRRDYKRVHRRDSDKDSDKQLSKNDIDAWKTLTIKLSRRDNKALYEELRTWLGTPYQYAADKKGEGTDCSGMVVRVYKSVYNKKLERNSAMMFEKNCKSISRDELREGDLVFFITGRSGHISHVGIYLKEGKFVHASSSRGVMVSDIEDKYWRDHYAASGRVK